MFGRDFWGNLERSGQATRVSPGLSDPRDWDANLEVWLPVGGPKGLLVYLHGGGNDARHGSWRMVQSGLEHGFAVALFHQAGHGRGGTSLFSRAAANERVKRVFERLQAEYPDLPFTVVGQSMGAAFLLDVLLEGVELKKSSSLAAAVVVSPPHSLRVRPEVFLFEARLLLQAQSWRLGWEFGVEETFPSAGKFRRDRFPVRVEEPNPHGNYIRCIENAVSEMSLIPRLKNHAKKLPPLLVLHGAKDRLIPVEQGEAIARLVPHAEYWERPNAAHFDILLNRSEADAVVGWLGQKVPSASN